MQMTCLTTNQKVGGSSPFQRAIREIKAFAFISLIFLYKTVVIKPSARKCACRLYKGLSAMKRFTESFHLRFVFQRAIREMKAFAFISLIFCTKPV